MIASYWHSLDGIWLSLEHVWIEQNQRLESVSVSVFKEGKQALGMAWGFLIRQVSEVWLFTAQWGEGEECLGKGQKVHFQCVQLDVTYI